VKERGCVYIVGAGPGDPGLLTIRAWRVLRRADVVFYDRLVPSAVLERSAPRARRVCVEKANPMDLSDLVEQMVREAAVPESVEFSSPDSFLLHRPMTRRPVLPDRSAARGISTGVTSRGTPGRAFRAMQAQDGQPTFVNSALYPGTGLVLTSPEMPKSPVKYTPPLNCCQPSAERPSG
jgi:hypothetical protein